MTPQPSTTSPRDAPPPDWAGFAPPPPDATTLRSDDLDEVRALISSYGNQHHRQTLARGPLGFAVDAVHCGGLDLGWIKADLPQKVRGLSQVPLLHLPLASSFLYDTPEGLRQARPDVAVLVAPGKALTLMTQPGPSLSWCLPAHSLEQELAARKGSANASEAPVWSRSVTELPLTGALAGGLRDLQQAPVGALAGPGLVGAGDRLSHLRTAAVSWVADRLRGLDEEGDGDRTRFVAARRVRQVEDWVDAHGLAPLTLGDLCRAAGVGERWLESAFYKVRGCSPMAFVHQRRLAHARRALLEPAPGATVARAAMDAGLLHLGRFSQAYGRAYGESPSRTLAQALERTGACAESG